MKKKPKDRHLDVPSEANRDKHINFVALESGDADPADLPAKKPLGGEEDNEENYQEDLKSEQKKKK